MNTKMDNYLPWITEWINKTTEIKSFNSEESTIFKSLKDQWNNTDRVILLINLKGIYGDKVKNVLNKFLREKTEADWLNIGIENKNNSIETFMKILWAPNMEEGFEYFVKNENSIYKVKCTKCPMFELANELNAHEWIFELACMSDYYMVNGFNKDILFSRSKTLIEGDDCCNHSYQVKTNLVQCNN
jgi:hypothetical protein